MISLAVFSLLGYTALRPLLARIFSPLVERYICDDSDLIVASVTELLAWALGFRMIAGIWLSWPTAVLVSLPSLKPET